MRKFLSNHNRSFCGLTLFACSAAMAAALPENNELFVFGNSRFLMIPTRPVVGIAASMSTNFAIQDDGQIVNWGSSSWAPSSGIRGAKEVLEWVTGAVALMDDGKLRSEPGILDSVRGVMHIYGNGYTFVVLDSNHVARSLSRDGIWLDTIHGVQDVALTNKETWYLRDDGVVLQGRKPMPDLGTYKKISGGFWHVAGLRADSTVKVWGSDTSFQQRLIPANLTGVIDIKAGGCHTTALRNDGSVESWGLLCPRAVSCSPSGPSETPCGWPDPKLSSKPPAGLGKVRSIAAGDYHSLALLQDGQIVAWGDSSFLPAILVPEGRAQIAAVEAGEESVFLLHNNGTLSIGSIPVMNLRWNSAPPPDAKGLMAISASNDAVYALDSSGSLHGWDSKGVRLSIPQEYITADNRSVPLPTSGIKSISAGGKLAIQTDDGRLLVLGYSNLFLEATPETRNARQIKVAEDRVYVLRQDGTVLQLAMNSPDAFEVMPWTRIRHLFGGTRCLVAQDSQNFIFLRESDTDKWDWINSWLLRPPDQRSFPPLVAMDAEEYLGLVGVDSTGHLIRQKDSFLRSILPSEVPPLKSVTQSRSYGFGIIAPGPLYAKTAPKPTRQVLSHGLASGTYPARLFDPRGNLLWEGQASWTEFGWQVPSKHRGLAVLHARTPSGTRTERLILAH